MTAEPGTELAVPESLVDVRSGEVLPATPENALALLLAARDIRRRLLSVVKDCEAVLLEESRRQGTKTMHLPGGTVTVAGGPGSELVWDFEVLARLIAVGLPDERWQELVTVKTTRTVNARVASQLEAANEDYAAIIREARGRADKYWSVSVK